ncbi:MAG: hypothetical protein ACE5MG_01710 [Candidatus Methylomirabilales bacterium]
MLSRRAAGRALDREAQVADDHPAQPGTVLAGEQKASMRGSPHGVQMPA